MKSIKSVRNIIKFNSTVILSFVLISTIALGLNVITQGYTNQLLFMVYRDSLLNPLFYLRLVGHIFGHADWAHFSGNMMFILLLGPLLEEKYGSWNIGVIIFVTAVSTGLINIVFFNTGLLGASGVVFAFVILSSITSVDDGRIPLTFIILAIIYIGGQIVDGIFISDNISNSTHIIGGIVGGSFGYVLNTKNKIRMG